MAMHKTVLSLSAAMKMIPTTTMTPSISTATTTWIVCLFISIVFASSSSSSTVLAFTTVVPSTTKTIKSAKEVGVASRSLLSPSLPSSQLVPLVSLLATSSSSSSSGSNVDDDDVIVVISPPGGIGEMTSIEAARLGGTVKWFVVSAPDSSTDGDNKSTNANAASGKQISLTAETLTAIEKAGGSLELAGASADSLLQVPAFSEIPFIGGSNSASSSSSSSLTAMASWCANASCIISTYDFGTANTLPSLMRMMDNSNNNLSKNSMEGDEITMMICAAIRLATKEAVLGMRRMQSSIIAEAAAESSDGGDNNNNNTKEKKKKKKNVMIAILPTGVEEEDCVTDKNDNNINNEASSGGLFGLDFFGGKDKNELVVPTTLMDAIGKQQNGVGGIIIRYGELFGAPESSVSI